MFGMIKTIGTCLKKNATVVALSTAAIAGLALTPSAQAGDRGRVDIDVNLRLGGHNHDRYEERTVKVWVPAEYRTVCEKVWIEPVYETRCEKVWIEPVYEMRCEKVWIPERHEYRQTRRFDRSCGRFVEVAEPVCIPGRWEEVHRRVCVREGGFQEVHKKVCVREGYFKEVHKQVCVREGRWEYRTERCRV
jgi:hypothetical protein